VVGHVTCDEIAGEMRLGGAAGYAARAAALLGVRTALVTAAPTGHPLLKVLEAVPGLTIHCRPSAVMTTFAVEYAAARTMASEGSAGEAAGGVIPGGASPPDRRLILRACAVPLTPDDIPPAWRAAPIAYVGPVAGECDRALVACLEGLVGAGIQGWLRRATAGGEVRPALHDLATRPPAALRVAVLSEQDHPDATDLTAALAATGVTVALTRAAAGATIWEGQRQTVIPAAPAQEVDPTGAGDVFGVVLTVGLARGLSVARAASAAALAAARVVEGPGLGRLDTLSAEELWGR
jgi:1D-myo-inositol 3-kinase